jgi:hypothetical protein
VFVIDWTTSGGPLFPSVALSWKMWQKRSIDDSAQPELVFHVDL